MKGHGGVRTVMEKTHTETGNTWPKILKYNYEKYADRRRAMRSKHYGIWRPHTWKDYYLNVKYLALGLLSIGFEEGDKVLIIGDSALEWYYAELAVQANHGIAVGLYSDLTSQELKNMASTCEAAFAVVQDQEQVDKFLEIKDDLPSLKKIIYWRYKGLAHYNDPILLRYNQMMDLGETYEKGHAGVFEKNIETGKPGDICAIVYTSGTTGPEPKAAVHTYLTMKTCADHCLRLDPWDENDDIVPYLPPAWMTEQCLLVGCHLLSACTLNFPEAPETWQRDTREISPTIGVYGARFWESQAATVQARILSADAVKRACYRKLMPVVYRMSDARRKKQKPGLFQKIFYFLAHFALIRPLKRRFGLSDIRICYSIGATLSTDSFKFYHALNLPLKSLYGSTEGGILTGAGNDDISFETVGPANDGVEVRTTDKSELIYRHPGIFIGYYKDPDATAQVLKDGWFHSGDCGFIRDDGHIVFLDRLENLIKLADGVQLAPQIVESRLRFSPYIADAWVLTGPDRDYASAIIVINYANVGRWAGQRRVAFTTFAELSQSPEVYDLIKKDISRINQGLPAGAKMRKYVNLPKEFDPDEAELTRTGNLRRTFLKERYQGLIDNIYSNKTEVPMEFPILYRDGRKGMVNTTLSIKSI